MGYDMVASLIREGLFLRFTIILLLVAFRALGVMMLCLLGTSRTCVQDTEAEIRDARQKQGAAGKYCK